KNGTVTQNGGNVIFTPTKDFVGTASFDYTVKDSKGATAKATFNITVAEVDEPLILKGNNQPIANGVTTSSVNCTDLGSAKVVGETKTCEYTLTNSNSIPVDVTIEQAEVPNSTASLWESAIQALNQLNPIKAAWAVGFADFSMSTRSLTVPANGSAKFLVVFDPSATGLRESLINLKVDGKVAHSFRIIGNGVADPSPPLVAKPIDPVTVNENAPATSLELKAVFTDPDNKALTLSIVSNTNSALVTPSLNGTLLSLAYAPNQTGSATITIRATAADGEIVETSFTVTVNPNSTTAIPIFNPFGLLALLAGLFWLGRRFKTN
ncbi:MAG: cadherin-like domain-containing protein, partial [Thiolinea sp.]